VPFEPRVSDCYTSAVNPNRIRLFIKPHCPWCKRAKEWLDERGIRYATLDVIADEAAFDEMRRLSGQTLSPVIEVDGKILADFGPDELATFWGTLNRDSANS
jgi:glutaredoxin